MKISMWSSTFINTALGGLKRSQQKYGSGLEKLSSGRRINRAADDAAGLSQASLLKAHIRTAQKAQHNIMDGINALQIADGGLSEIQDHLTRLRQLTVQAASQTVDDAGRSMIQQEAAGILSTIDSIAKSASYNNTNLLYMSHIDVAFCLDVSYSMGGEIAQVTNSINDFHNSFTQAGVDIEFALAEMGMHRDNQDGVVVRVDMGEVGFNEAIANPNIASGLMDPYSALLNITGIDDFNHDNDVISWRNNVNSVVILVTDTTTEYNSNPSNPSQTQVAQALKEQGFQVFVICDPADASHYQEIADETGGAVHSRGDTSGNLIPTAMNNISQALESDAPAERIPLEVQFGTEGDNESRMSIGLPVDATPVYLGLGSMDLSTVEGALSAMDDIDSAIQQTSGYRSEIGAKTNRLSAIWNQQATTVENETAAMSQIEDQDMASGTADTVKYDILRQGSVSVLSQAMKLQQDIVMSLINGNL